MIQNRYVLSCVFSFEYRTLFKQNITENTNRLENLRHSGCLFISVFLFRSLMRSSEIEVSYFAAGIAAHLSSDQDVDWSTTTIDKRTVITELVSFWPRGFADVVLGTAYLLLKNLFWIPRKKLLQDSERHSNASQRHISWRILKQKVSFERLEPKLQNQW